MYHLLCIGDPIIDTHIQLDDECKECHVFEEHNKYLALDYGAKIPIVDSFQALGGNAPNVAVASAKLGRTSAVISTIGSDGYGRMAIDFLKRFNVDTGLVTTQNGATTRYSIVLNYHQERTILSYSEKKEYIWPNPVPPAEWIYYTGLSEGFEPIQQKLLEYLAEHPTTKLAINPGSYILAHALKTLQEIVAKADLLIVNLEEAERIAGESRDESKGEAGLIHKLVSLGAKEVVLTDGGRGAWAGTSDELWHLDAFPVKVTSKTGAGDAFSAAYMTARSLGHDLPRALEWGTANSTGVIQRHGPQAGLLDQKGIEKMVEKFIEVEPTQL